MTTQPLSSPTQPTPPEANTGSNNNSNSDGDDVNTILSTIQARFQQMKVASASADAPSADDDDAAVSLLYKDYERIVSVGEECIHPNELLDLLIRQGRGSLHRTTAANTTDSDTEQAVGFNLYDGFEPSGRMHIAQGIFKVHNVNKCTYQNNGGTFIFWIADWFALMKYVSFPSLISCVLNSFF
jgi:tRNA synthetases class I (W and Y)